MKTSLIKLQETKSVHSLMIRSSLVKAKMPVNRYSLRKVSYKKSDLLPMIPSLQNKLQTKRACNSKWKHLIFQISLKKTTPKSVIHLKWKKWSNLSKIFMIKSFKFMIERIQPNTNYSSKGKFNL